MLEPGLGPMDSIRRNFDLNYLRVNLLNITIWRILFIFVKNKIYKSKNLKISEIMEKIIKFLKIYIKQF